LAQCGILFALCVGFCSAGCKQQAPTKPANAATSPTIASLVPSATDLLIGMNATDHLVAVSNYDLDPQTARLPRVGDYETIDWEKISSLHPDILVTDYAPGRTPAGMTQRMQQLGIRGLNVKFDRLTDIYDAASILGEACNEPAKAAAMLVITRDRVQLIHDRVAGDTRVPAAIITGESGMDFAGQNNYLNDLLNEAGGQNVVTSAGYPTLDREAIAALRPQVILQLLPRADAAARQRVAKFWRSLPDIPAVRENRVYLLTEPYVMTPGAHVGEMATRFAGALHPDKETLSETPLLNANATP
jgi:iron complex transport system substrate-binding protein